MFFIPLTSRHPYQHLRCRPTSLMSPNLNNLNDVTQHQRCQPTSFTSLQHHDVTQHHRFPPTSMMLPDISDAPRHHWHRWCDPTSLMLLIIKAISVRKRIPLYKICVRLMVRYFWDSDHYSPETDSHVPDFCPFYGPVFVRFGLLSPRFIKTKWPPQNTRTWQ